MAQYTLIDPGTGVQASLTEAKLTRNLQLNCILLRDGDHLGIIIHRDLVAFTRWCAGVSLAQVKGAPAPEAQYALTLVDRWLEDEKSVTSEELEAAQDAAHEAAWAAAASAADAAAAWAARAAAGAAAGAAEAAARAARAAASAAWAAAWAARAARAADAAAAGAASYEAQAQWWVEHLQTGK